MTTSERINAISSKRANLDMIERKRQSDMDLAFAELEGKAKELAPRVADLIEVAKAFCDYGFTLGEKHGTNAPQFVTDGITHKMGFYTNANQYLSNTIPGSSILGIGREGGGCSNATMYITVNGEIAKLNDGWCSKECRIKQLRSILNAFDTFEDKFYEFADNL